jgi:ribosomal protein S12 methylthiotransferase accessory factor
MVPLRLPDPGRPLTAAVGVRDDRPSALSSLVSPFGVIHQALTIPPPRGLAMLTRATATIGTPGQEDDRETVGLGSSLDDPVTASTVALAEAAERYAGEAPGLAVACRLARAADLDGAVVDLKRLPRCSVREHATPGCRVRPFDADSIIHWSRGIELASGVPMWVPSIMAVYGLRNRTPGERFWVGISTGYAVHTDPLAALCSAICEVAERDIVEILWQQRLPLPPVAARELSASCRTMLRWAEDHFIRIVLFDATTDMGVPTAYCLLIAEHDAKARHMVSCATGVTLGAAAEKCVRDGISFSDHFGGMPDPGTVKMDPRDFTTIADGQRYMGLAEHASAFDFLVDGYEDRAPQERPVLPQNPEGRLRSLIDTVTDKGMQAIAVDRTTSELAAAGLTAVCVVIPDLQPMTLQPLVRFRAHPRLYSAPILMGYRALPEAQLNPWPQPFA